jgi:hypothetical protein
MDRWRLVQTEGSYLLIIKTQITKRLGDVPMISEHGLHLNGSVFQCTLAFGGIHRNETNNNSVDALEVGRVYIYRRTSTGIYMNIYQFDCKHSYEAL